MPLTTRLLAAALAAVAVPTAAVAIAAGEKRLVSPGPALATANGVTLPATQGGYCVSGPVRHGSGVGLCADYAYPLRTHGSLPAAAGDEVMLRFRHNPRIYDRPQSVAVALLHVRGDRVRSVGMRLEASQVPGHRRRWILTLPADIGDANVLDLSTAYQQGDADFWVAIHPPG